MPTLGHICFGMRARAAKCWNLGAIFTPKKKSIQHYPNGLLKRDLKSGDNLQQWRFFFRNQSSNKIYLASKLVKTRKIERQNFFLLNVCGLCRGKNSKNSGRDGQHLGHFVQPVQLFSDQGLLIKGQFFSTNPRSGVEFCREKSSKTSSRDDQNCSQLVQPVQLFESKKFRDYWSTLTCYISWLVFFTWEITGTQVFYPSFELLNFFRNFYSLFFYFYCWSIWIKLFTLN